MNDKSEFEAIFDPREIGGENGESVVRFGQPEGVTEHDPHVKQCELSPRSQ